MKHCRFSMAVLLLVASVSPASAGIFGKRAKPNPAERVPALIVTVRADVDEHKRSAAAEQLRQYDPTQFPEIIPTLAEVAQHDPKAGVRLEAIQSLAKLRPVSQQAGLTLEQAAHDDSMRVRMQARTLLFQYRLAGYRGAKTPEMAAPPNLIHTDEPPLATPPEAQSITNSQRSMTFPPAPVVSMPMQPASEPVSGMPKGPSAKGPSTRPAQGGCAKGTERGPRQEPIRWAPAGSAPKSLPLQPVAVPLEARSPTGASPRAGTVRILEAAPRTSSQGTAKAAAAGPRPLPTGPAKPANAGPKPLPPGPESGPAETPVVPAENATKEPPLAPSEEEGPDLSPPN